MAEFARNGAQFDKMPRLCGVKREITVTWQFSWIQGRLPGKKERGGLMMHGCDLRAASAGQVLTTDEFLVSPTDMSSYVESSFIREVVGCCEERLSSGAVLEHDPGWGRVVPESVLLARAIAALCGQGLAQAEIEVCSVGRVRVMAPAIVGEPLLALARVRFSSRRAAGRTLTREVGVRRSGGELLRFELALEVAMSSRSAA